jgi:starch phosphorylase
LIFRDQERLKRILNDPARPVQLIFAGKAHPADEPGKSLIQTVYQLSRQPGFAGKVVFVEDYDANVARHLVSGVDVWLNNPRRPLEASGTSGQKAGLNGVPNFSVLDGWWSEGYEGENGWAIGAERDYHSESAQDEADALSLYATLEREIVPAYYDAAGDGPSSKWLQLMRASIASVGPAFSFDRMLKEYVVCYYAPAGKLGAQLLVADAAGARALADWEERVSAAWGGVRIEATGPASGEMTIGKPLPIRAVVLPNGLTPSDLAVELVFGKAVDGTLATATALPMRLVRNERDRLVYEAGFDCQESGQFAYGVRVRPDHPDLPNPFAANLLLWA